jgi:hypothetical protein
MCHDLVKKKIGDRSKGYCGSWVAVADFFYGVCS